MSLSDSLDLISHSAALLLGFGNLIFLTLGSMRYKNVYLRYFWITYFATTVMLAAYTLDTFMKTLWHRSFGSFRGIVSMTMFFITCYCTLLVLKLLYENTPGWVYLAVYAVSAPMLLFIPVSFFIPADIQEFILKIEYVEFYIALALNCVLFFIGFKRLDKPYKKFSRNFGIVLSIFVIIFFLQVFFCIRFNPLPPFYALWSILLIVYFWKDIFLVSIAGMSSGNMMEKYHITEREKDIIDLIIQGKSNKAIGDHLYISEKTVKNHIYNVYKKLEIRSRFELMGLFNTQKSPKPS